MVLQIKVGEHEVQMNKSYMFRDVGFSPQEDPLWQVITMEEHLECYAELRGIPKSNVENVVRR